MLLCWQVINEGDLPLTKFAPHPENKDNIIQFLDYKIITFLKNEYKIRLLRSSILEIEIETIEKNNLSLNVLVLSFRMPN